MQFLIGRPSSTSIASHQPAQLCSSTNVVLLRDNPSNKISKDFLSQVSPEGVQFLSISLDMLGPEHKFGHAGA